MKVYIITDLEGISGIGRADMVEKTSPDYPYALERLMADTNAAVAGAFDGGADEVLVEDGHGGGDNFLPGKLDPRAKENIGKTDYSTIDAIMHVGAHAMAGTLNAFLDHTQSSVRWFDYRINGRSMGEMGQEAVLAGVYNIPTIFVSGDEAACLEARQFFGNISTAPVKYAVGRNTAVCLDDDEAAALIRRRAAESIAKVGKLRPFYASLPLEIQLTYTRADYCDNVCERRNDVERLDARTIRRRVDKVTVFSDLL